MNTATRYNLRKRITCFLVISMCIFTFLLSFYSYTGILHTHMLHTLLPEKGLVYTTKIIKNNLLNFLQYLFFPLAPFLILKDDFLLSVSIGSSVVNSGVFITMKNLFPHGFLEIPNILCYQFLSITLFFQLFWRSHKTILPFIKSFKNVYLFSLILIFISAILEGMI